MPLRIGSLSDRARPLTSGYDREARRLKRKGFDRAAEALALEGSKDRLQNGNIRSAEDRAESEQIADQAARLDRRLRYNALKGVDGTKPIQNTSTQSVTGSPSSASSSPSSASSSPNTTPQSDFGIPNPAPLPESPLINSYRPFGKEDQAGRDALRAEYDRVNPSSEPGNLAELQRARFGIKPPVGTTPSQTAEPAPQGRSLDSWIDEFKGARDSTKAVLDKTTPSYLNAEAPLFSDAMENKAPLATPVANPIQGPEKPLAPANPGVSANFVEPPRAYEDLVDEGYTSLQAQKLEKRKPVAKPNKETIGSSVVPKIPINPTFDGSIFNKVLRGINRL